MDPKMKAAIACGIAIPVLAVVAAIWQKIEDKNKNKGKEKK